MKATFHALILAALAAVVTLAVPSPAHAEDGASEEDFVYATMKTNKGDIVIELNHDLAPITVANFLAYADKGFYEGAIFHRVVNGSIRVIQGGGFDAELSRKPTDAPIKNEWRNGLTNDRGTIAMARTPQPDSATSQFYINVQGNNAILDPPRVPGNPRPDPVNGAAYCVFGRIVEGMDVVDAIAAVETTQSNPKMLRTPVPVEPVVIESVERIDGERRADLMESNKSERESIQAAAKERRDEIEEQRQAPLRRAEDAKRPADVQRADGIEMLASKGYELSAEDGTLTDSGLWYHDVEVGDGAQPTPTSTVTVHYTGWFTDGAKFDSSHDHPGGNPAQYSFNQVIRGWTEGVGGMKPGGKRLLVVPAAIAYGARGRSGIPGGATLVFEVELLSVQ